MNRNKDFIGLWGVLSILNISIFNEFTHNIFDLAAFGTTRAIICYVLFSAVLAAGVLVVLQKNHKIVALILFAVIAAFWLCCTFVGKGAHLSEAMENGYMSKSSFINLRVIILMNLIGCVLQAVLLLASHLKTSKKQRHIEQNTKTP